MAGVTERSATVDSGGRGGDVTYSDPSGTLRFPWEVTEYGYEVSVPTRERWEADTGLSLAVRDDTLAFLAAAFIAKRGTERWTFAIVETPFASIQIRP